jgi:hypothetical protein
MEDLPSYTDIIFYTSAQGSIKLEVYYEGETFWLNQKRLSELFDVESNTINYHLKEIYQSGELELEPTTRKIRVVQKEGS